MGDFGTILWVLVIIGFVASNYVSKAQKSRGKGTPHTGEAWPSSEEEEEEPRREESGIPGIPGIPDIFDTLPTPTARPAAPRTPRHPETSADKAAGRERASEGAASVPTPRNRAAEAEITPRNAPQAISSGTSARRKNSAPETGDEAKAKADIAAALQAAGQQEAPDSPLGEEFDLRRAVIYSEILKPKFEEP
ncbi:MAG TPA: hypothetical protein H9920_01815 [Candidatus Alistipes faecavium]|nr:hypothetical protein [Candidatus Alistipes faecavium]